MKFRTDTYTAITLFGIVEVDFPEDGGVVFDGPASAVEHLKSVIDGRTGTNGISLTPQNLEPYDFYHFCQPKGSMVTILEPWDDLLSGRSPYRNNDDDEGDGYAVMDDASGMGMNLDSVGGVRLLDMRRDLKLATTVQEKLTIMRAMLSHLDNMRDKEDKTPDVGPFGPILTQYHHNAQEAIEALTKLQDGEAVAALHHPEIGDIDLVWGRAPEGGKDGFGLAKLIVKHPEVLQDLQGFLSRLRKDPAQSGGNRIRLVDERGTAIVRLQWEGQSKKWLLTAFEDKALGVVTRTDIGNFEAKDDTASLGTEGNQSLTEIGEAVQDVYVMEENGKRFVQLFSLQQGPGGASEATLKKYGAFLKLGTDIGESNVWLISLDRYLANSKNLKKYAITKAGKRMGERLGKAMRAVVKAAAATAEQR
ncbi:hypothetical protein [Macromonas bipunctata]|uniref:putative barnase/colicin E5 family endoribonuclease n=1 Tax=Macromonas bipunctata TaxID=183670 RepID=UPI000C32B620|nr:hypothetical protein [Macromonas bipunctata]